MQLMMQPEVKIGEIEDRRDKVEPESTLMMQPEEKIGEEQDVKSKEDNISQDSGYSDGSSSYYRIIFSEYKNRKRWYRAVLSGIYDRDEQVAFLLGVLKCDKSELCSIYKFCTGFMFQAYMTNEEAENLCALDEVDDIVTVLQRDKVQSVKRNKSGIFGARSKSKKQKLSPGSILSERRQNKEKWRYNEDLEKEAKIVDSEEDFSGDEQSWDDSGDDSYESYIGFDEFGKRWYKVRLLHGKTDDDQMALLLDVLKCDKSDICSIYEHYTSGMFKARMTEEEADRVAGSEEVEFVEPLRYAVYLN